MEHIIFVLFITRAWAGRASVLKLASEPITETEMDVPD